MPKKGGPKWSVKSYGGFKGLNSITDKSILGTNTADCLNVRHIVPGFILPSIFTGGGFGEPQQEAITSIRTVTGYVQYNTTQGAGASATVKGLYDYRVNAGGGTFNRNLIAYTSDGGLWTIPTGAGSAWTNVGIGYNTGANVYGSFETYNNKCLFANGKDAMQVWDGVAAAFTNVVASAWTTKSTLATATSRDLRFSINNIGYYVGFLYTNTDNLYSYQQVSDTWISLGYTLDQRGGGACGSIMGLGYINGGSIPINTIINTTTSYNPSSNSWTLLANSTVARYFPSTFQNSSLNELFIYAGSTTAIYSNVVNSIEYYSPIGNTWTSKTSGGTAGFMRPSTEDYTYGYSFAGLGISNNNLSALDLYNAATDSWSSGTATSGNALRNSSSDACYANNLPYIIETSNLFSYNTSAATYTTLAVSSAADDALSLNNFIIFVKYGTATYSYNTNPAPPIAYYLKNYNGSVFAARSDTNPSRVWYSTVGTHDVWDPNAFFDVSKDDGGWITGMAIINQGSQLIVFKTTGLYSVNGTIFDPVVGNFYLTPITGIGCASAMSIAKSPTGKIYYLGVDGRIHEFNGVQAIPCSDMIVPTTQNYTGRSYEYCQAVYVPVFNEYRILFANTGTTTGKDRMIIFNEVTHQFFPVTPAVSMDCIALMQNPGSSNGIAINSPIVLTGGCGTGLVYQWDKDLSGNDCYQMDGSAINSYYNTAWLDCGNPQAGGNPYRKLFRRMYSKLKQAGNWNVNIDSYADYNTATAQATQTVNTNNTDLANRVDLSFHARVASFKFSTNTLNQWFDLSDFDLFYELKGGGLWTSPY